jgi:hypothetical protein
MARPAKDRVGAFESEQCLSSALGHFLACHEADLGDICFAKGDTTCHADKLDQLGSALECSTTP